MTVKGLIISLGRRIKKAKIVFFNRNIVLGEGVIIDYCTRLYTNNNKLVINDNAYLRSKSKGYQAGMPYPTTILIDVKNAYVEIGRNTRINGAYIHAQKRITIGDNCVIASGVNILDTNGHQLLAENRTLDRDTPSDIIIGNNVWIGLNAIVLKGSKIGDNSVISAGSVVKDIFPKNSLIMGNPARVIKTLLIT